MKAITLERMRQQLEPMRLQLEQRQEPKHQQLEQQLEQQLGLELGLELALLFYRKRTKQLQR
jgi:hypothetical protein